MSDGEARVARTDDAPDMAIGAAELGAAYLGGTSFARLRAAGRVDETSGCAVARADALFRSDVTPWCPELF